MLARLSEVAPGRPTGRSKIPRLVCSASVRDLFRHTIFGIGGRGGVGRLHRASGRPIRHRPPSQLGVRDLHPAVRSRGPQDVEDRVIGCSSGLRQPAKIPARYRSVRVVLAKRPVQRGTSRRFSTSRALFNAAMSLAFSTCSPSRTYERSPPFPPEPARLLDVVIGQGGPAP